MGSRAIDRISQSNKKGWSPCEGALVPVEGGGFLVEEEATPPTRRQHERMHTNVTCHDSHLLLPFDPCLTSTTYCERLGLGLEFLSAIENLNVPMSSISLSQLRQKGREKQKFIVDLSTVCYVDSL
jgi:hypothetical protein